MTYSVTLCFLITSKLDKDRHFKLGTLDLHIVEVILISDLQPSRSLRVIFKVIEGTITDSRQTNAIYNQHKT